MDDLISRESVKRLTTKRNNIWNEVTDAEGRGLDEILDSIPSIDAVPVQDGILKARKGDYVTYRIDWLLDHLAQEISLLEGYRRGRKEDG